ncbi:GNAT family N-acetyltransferase [Chitinivorax sp. PXF-14]|uniref:GNAT family N-acetyltransferase n=1 Tax=Chitinivorax sp. PXF-14 TaxID=3230488 RepID=UPI0034652346
MGITIRPAGLSDADELVTLCGQLGYTIEKSALCHNLAMIGENPHAAVFVAQVENGAVVGFIGVERRVMLESPPRIEITGLVVDAALRRQRIASRLLDTACGWGRRQGVARVVLRSSSQRAEAHQFYLDYGFEITKQQLVFALTQALEEPT